MTEQSTVDPAAGAPRGLLIDFGGVLTSDVFASFATFCDSEGLETDKVKTLFRADPAARELLVELEIGAVTSEEFEKRFAGLLGVGSESLIDRLMAHATLDTAMLDVVRAARRAGVRTGLISNSWGAERYDRALLDELFDGVVISGEVGLRKPDPEMYRLGAQSVGLSPDECVYVDDLGGNLKPARAMGMTTLLHQDAASTVAELERLFGLTSPAR